MNCPNCNQDMTQLGERSFSCTPCRQSVRVYPVAGHQHLRSIEREYQASRSLMPEPLMSELMMPERITLF